MSNVIAAGNVQIGMSANGLYAEAKRVKAEMAAMKRVVRDTADPQQELARKQLLLTKAMESGAFASTDLTRRMDALNAKYKAIADSANKAASSSKSLSGELRSLVLAGIAFAGAGSFLKSIVSLSSQFEQAQTDYAILTGGRESGNKLVAQLRQIDKESILSFQSLSQSATTLLSFGVAADQVAPTLRKLGEITGGNTSRFEMLSLAWAQAAAAGRLMGQDLLQMVNAGFNPLQEISKRTGYSMIELKKLMEDGAIGFDVLSMSARTATEAGGMFYERMKEQQGTLAGQWARVNSQINELKLQIGNDLLPLMKDLVAEAKKFVDSDFFKSLGGSVKWARENVWNPGKFSGPNKDAVMKSIIDRAREAQKKRDEAQKEEENKRLGGKNQEMINYLEKTKKAKQDLELQKEITGEFKKQSEERKRILERGQSIMEKFNPELKIKNDLLELLSLFNAGAIDRSTMMKAGMDVMRDKKKPPKEEISKTVLSGSQEAYRLLFNKVDKKDDQKKVLEEQKALQQRLVSLAMEQIEAIKNNALKAFR
jgi:tape measure domain-containing protein